MSTPMRSLLLPHNTPTTLSAFTLSTEAASTQAMHLNRRIFIKCDLSFPLSLSSFLVYSPLYSTISYRQGFREITASFSILDSPAYTHKNKERERGTARWSTRSAVPSVCCRTSHYFHAATRFFRVTKYRTTIDTAAKPQTRVMSSDLLKSLFSKSNGLPDEDRT